VSWIDNNIENIYYPLTIFPDDTTGLEWVKNSSDFFQIRCYPNPSSGVLTVETNLENPGTMLIEIHDAFGRKCFVKEITSSMKPDYIRLDLSMLPPGIYQLLLYKDRGLVRAERLILN
jgi:hypothetical protein